MTYLGLLFYFFFFFIRPQDWYPALYNKPVDVIIFSIILIISIVTREFYFSLKNNYFRIYIVWFIFVVFSNIIHGDIDGTMIWFEHYRNYFIIFICLFSAANSPFKTKILIWFVILLASVLALQNHQMIQSGVGWAGQSLGWGDERRARWVGQWDGMGSYCLIFVSLFPFLLWYSLLAKRVPYKLLYLIIGLWIFYGGFLTKARGGLIASLATIGVYYIDRFRNVKAILIVVVIIIGFFALAPGRFTNFNDDDDSASNRIVVWDQGYEMLQYNPLWGIGRGHYQRYTGSIMAHNTFLNIAGETGIIGLFLWLSLLYLCMKGLLLSRKVCQPEMLPIVNGLLYCLIGYQFSSFFVTTETELLYVYYALAGSVATHTVGHIEFGKKDVRNVIFIEIGGLLFFWIIVMVYKKVYGM
jgi:O-antigen ligase